uniref:STAS domain-containing protein n=1 Tax=Picea sitchensis TaxID=3332 RepID=C0PPQ5_PICSI|nr:unknown [Picea sitchensis]
MVHPVDAQPDPDQRRDGHDHEDSDIGSAPSSRKNGDDFAPVYRVGAPPRLKLINEFKIAIKETLFPDDPFRQFKDQPRPQKIRLGVEGMFPILEWGRTYTLSKFKGDLIAGLTIASLCIPQDIGYAKLANLDPQYGLYSSFLPPFVYAVMGSSRDIAIGPVAVVSILLGTLVRNEIDDIKSADYHRLIITSTFFAGVFQAVLGICRFGFLIDFLSHASIVGFMAGAAITIGLQQLKLLLGIQTFTKKTDIISVMKSVWGAVHHGWNWQTILIGVFFLIFLLTAKYIGKKNRRLFWVPAVAPLISVILATLIVYLSRSDKHGVQIVNHIKKGINPSSISQLAFSGTLLVKGVKIGFVAALIALTEGIAIGRTFAALKDYHLDGNKEMLAMGVMNVAGSLTSCYVTTGSFSRSAVNYNAGCRSAVSNVVMSIVVLLTLLVITPLFKYTPNAILASIIISAVINLIDIKAAHLIWKTDKLDFLACVGAFIGVVFKSVEYGLLIAVALSFGKILLQVTRPRTALLGRIPGTNIFRNIEQYPDASKIHGILVVRIDSAMYFSNANYIRERILRWVDDEGDKIQEKAQMKLQFLVVEMSPIIDIDTSGIHALEELHTVFQKRDLQLALANPGRAVIDKLFSSKFVDTIGQEWIFLTVGEAVQTCSRRLKFDV